MKKTLSLLVLMLTAIAPLMADKMQPSSTLPNAGKPEHVYIITSGNGVTSNALTSPTQTEANYGQFAFYPHIAKTIEVNSLVPNAFENKNKSITFGDTSYCWP